MAPTRTTRKQSVKAPAKGKTTKAKGADPTGGGGLAIPPQRQAVTDSTVGKKSALSERASMTSRVDSTERRQLLNELLHEIDRDLRRTAGQDAFLADCIGESENRMAKLEQEVHARGVALERMRIHLYRALRWPTMPDESGAINGMLRRAPTAWHIRAVVEQAIEVLLSHSRRCEREVSSMRCLGEIARLFQHRLKKSRGRSFREAMEHPAYLEAFNKPLPKRTRGGTGGNDSPQVVFTWCEFAFKEFDEQHNPNFDPLVYADTEAYIQKFMAFAKVHYEQEGDRFKWAETLTGKKVRTNNGQASGKPKQGFSFFKHEIEDNVRSFLERIQNEYAPVWVWTEQSPAASAIL